MTFLSSPNFEAPGSAAGSNTYTGQTSVQAGGLTLSGGQAIADTAALSVASGATLTVNNNETLASLTAAGTAYLEFCQQVLRQKDELHAVVEAAVFAFASGKAAASAATLVEQFDSVAAGGEQAGSGEAGGTGADDGDASHGAADQEKAGRHCLRRCDRCCRCL